jgi:ribosomal protein S18 acetylase RimI-like enzyme
MTQATDAEARPQSSEEAIPEVRPVPRLPGVRIRLFRDDADFERLAVLLKECNLHDEIPWLPTVGNLRSEMENRSSVDPRRDVLLAELDDRTVGMTGVERVVRDGAPVYEMWGCVLADVRRRGLGTALLDWSLARIRQRAAIEDPGVPIVVQGDSEEQEVGHRALLAAGGFTAVRWFFLMRRPTLDDVPGVPLPDGLEIRPVAEDQYRPILEAEFEAFKDHWGTREPSEEHFALTLSRAELDTDLWVVAWDGDQIAGVVENWIWPDENAELGVKRGWLERISVRRPWRRRGLARALTARSLVLLREAGMEEGMLGVDSENANGALGLYEGLGFEVHSRSAAYRRSLDL